MSDFEIDILIEDPRWNKELSNLAALAEIALRRAYEHLPEKPGVTSFSEVSLAFIDDEKGRRLNRQYRNKDKPTNVLSFEGMDIDGARPMLGDIVLSYETVVREARERHMVLSDHVTHLMIHGFYHLLGFDHQNKEEARQMEALEIRALRALGIANPYVKDEVL